MRERMQEHRPAPKEPGFDFKHDAGGLIDIEFLCQYLVLRHAMADPALTNCRANTAIIARLVHTQKIAPEEATTLSSVLQLYLTRENALKLSRRPALAAPEAFQDERRAITQLWNKYLDPDKSLH
jgi:glutamate-ammonia-ligase adenylyltransferase